MSGRLPSAQPTVVELLFTSDFEAYVVVDTVPSDPIVVYCFRNAGGWHEAWCSNSGMLDLQ